MSDEIQVHYEFKNIKFVVEETTNKGIALADGDLNVAGAIGRFGIALAPKIDGEWELKDVRGIGNITHVLQREEVLQSLVNKCADLLKTINMWPEKSESGNGAQILLNQKLAPSEVADRVIISFRPEMLLLPMTNWDAIWSLIEGRISGDQYFRVQGFNKNEVEKAMKQLKYIFPESWVRARYRKVSQNDSEPLLSADFPPETDNWFPAYHLARTALGAICIDPGWNYLVEIGLSISELAEFEGLKRLKKQLTRSPGTQHHLCFAAEMYRKGHLLALEPLTGSGNSRNDLLVACGDRQYEIEVKEFGSANPARQLAQEIEKKSKQLPNLPERPIVFHAVLIEKGVFEKEKEDGFFQAVKELKLNISPKISAVVAGKRFVDSLGGRVKRDSEIQILNPSAFVPSNADDLATLFAKNYDEFQYPVFGIGSFFYFSQGE